MNWKKYLLLLISAAGVVLLTQQIINACADYNYYDNYPRFFGNEAPDQPAFYPFHFISGDKYYDDYRWTDGHAYTVRDSVNQSYLLKEWSEYAGKDIPIEDIKTLLYEGDVTTLEGLQKGLNELPENAFVTYLLQKKNKPVLDYLLYAKKCEINAQEDQADWNYEEAQEKRADNEELKKEGLTLLINEKDSFLQMKYIFQVLRMAFYSDKDREVLRLYDDFLKGKENKSVAVTRAIGFRAGAYYGLNELAKAAYYYSKMFDHSDAYLFSAEQSFEWALRHTDLSDVYAFCKNDHERATVVVMKALREYDRALDLIKKAYELDPKVKGLDVLINREINKLEEDYFASKIFKENQLEVPEYSYFWWYPYEEEQDPEALKQAETQTQKYLGELYDFSGKLIKEGQMERPSLWYLVQAYLSCMQDRPSDMKEKLELAKKEGLNQNEEEVYQVIDLLYSLYKNKEITPEIESEILPKLKALDQKAKSSELGSSRFRDIMTNLVAGKYFQQGDTIRGIFAMGHAVSWERDEEGNRIFYSENDFEDRQGDLLNKMSVTSLKKVIAYREETAKKPFDQWLANHTYYSTDVLKELLGVKYIRKQGFKNAAEVLSKLPPKYSRDFPSPFMPHINDYQERKSSDSVNMYTRLRYSQRMAELKAVIQKDPNDAGAIYGYALALYNTSYYGKSGNIVAYSRHSTDFEGYYLSKKDRRFADYEKEYYRVYEAETYFKKAAEASTDPEVKAKALWGAAKCWQKRCPLPEEEEYWYPNASDPLSDPYYNRSLENPYFQALHEQLKNTQFVKEITVTCDYYLSYTAGL